MNSPYILGDPGMRTPLTAEYRRVLESTSPNYLPGGRRIDGTKTRDPGNYPYQDAIRAGLIMGPVTGQTGLYANSFLGLTLGTSSANGTALPAAGGSLCVSIGTAVELVRRQGASGTFKILGPKAASTSKDDTRYATVTYSAVNTSTGIITTTAVGSNEVQRVDFGVAATGGSVRLIVPKADGTLIQTNVAAWSGTDATFLANINTVLDAATGVVGGIVATAIPSVDTDLGFLLTFSGTGYAGNTYSLVQVTTTPTSVTTSQVTRSTTGSGGVFIAGSWVCPTDGTEVPTLILPDGPASPMTDISSPSGVNPLAFPLVPMAAHVRTQYLIDYPTDPGMKLYLKDKLSTTGGPKLMFDDAV